MGENRENRNNQYSTQAKGQRSYQSQNQRSYQSYSRQSNEAQGRQRSYQYSYENEQYERQNRQRPQRIPNNRMPQNSHDTPDNYKRNAQSYQQQAASQARRRRIVVTVIAVIVVAVIAVFAVNLIVGQQGQDTAAVDDSQHIDQAVASQSQQTYTAPDRSNFAVQPGNIPSNYDGTDEYVVYLTIDDGPSDLTPYYLDLFDKYNVKATFFVTGHSPQYADYIKDAYDRGHTIGLHTYSHDYAAVYASDEAYFEDLDQIAQLVKGEIGYVPCFIRFPGGSSNSISAKYSNGIMSRLVNEVQERGYQYYDWNVSTGDGSNLSTEEIIEASCNSNRHNIVLLCHDSATKQTTLDALPTIIEHYQSLGYTFKAIDRESFVPHHGVSN